MDPINLRARGDGSLTANGVIEVVGTLPVPVISFVGPPAAATSGAYPGDVRSALWKEPYTVVMRIQNSAITTMHYTLSLEEAENTREAATGVVTNMLAGPLTAIESRMVTLTPGEQQDISFSPISKNWVWLTAGAWIATGPTLRGFTYDLRFTATDEFGNPIAAMNSVAQIRVEVSVSQQKINFMMAAEGLSISAAILAIAGAFWAPLLVASAVAYAGATAFGASALDPPTPDPNFDDQVKIGQPAIIKYTDEIEAKAFGEWLRATVMFAETRKALYLIEAKILGAHAADKTDAESDRVKEYVSRLQEMSSYYQTMVSNAGAAVKELEERGVTDKSVLDRLLDAQQKFMSGDLNNAIDAQRIEDAGIDLSDLYQRVLELRPEQVSLLKLFQGITLSVGKSLRSVIHDSASQYANMRSDYFSKQNPKWQ